MSLLGLDLGTSGCKAVVFSGDGRVLCDAYREYNALHPNPGWSELDCHEVWRLVKESIAEVAGQCLDDPIEALSVSSLGEACVMLDSEGEILGNSILCSDIRGEKFAEELKRDFTPLELYAINPNIPGVNYSLPKILWLRENDPDTFQRCEKILLWADFIVYALTGEAFGNPSLANRTLLYDLKNGDWSDRLLKKYDLPKDKFPEIVPSGTVAGLVKDSVAKDLGMSNTVKVVIGGHDQCCNSLGAGASRAGRAVCGIGTFECVTPSFDVIPDHEFMMKHGLNIEDHVVPGLFVTFIYNQAGSLVRWFRDAFAADEKARSSNPEELFQVLEKEIPSAAVEALVLPYFEPTGPPDFLCSGDGVIAGLRTDTKRGEILKGLMESITFYFVECLESLKEVGFQPKELIATGGGAKSDRWLQIKADILNTPVVKPKITECSALGAAMLAGIGAGLFEDAESAMEIFCAPEKIFYPEESKNEYYKVKYQRYRKLLNGCRSYWS